MNPANHHALSLCGVCGCVWCRECGVWRGVWGVVYGVWGVGVGVGVGVWCVVCGVWCVVCGVCEVRTYVRCVCVCERSWTMDTVRFRQRLDTICWIAVACSLFPERINVSQEERRFSIHGQMQDCFLPALLAEHLLEKRPGHNHYAKLVMAILAT